VIAVTKFRFSDEDGWSAIDALPVSGLLRGNAADLDDAIACDSQLALTDSFRFLSVSHDRRNGRM